MNEKRVGFINGFIVLSVDQLPPIRVVDDVHLADGSKLMSMML